MKNIRYLLNTLRFICSHPLNARRKGKALCNYFRWQAGIRIIQKSVIIPWVDDSRLIAGKGEKGLTANLYGGLSEYESMGFLLHALQPRHLFVDVGANVGAYTVLASQVVRARTIAFEPLPDTVERLKDQVQINRIEQRVDIRSKGVGSKRTTLCFTNNRGTENRVSLTGGGNTTKIDVTTLDSELDLSDEYFVKIDVEGFEYEVLEGGARIFASANLAALIIELNGHGDCFGHANESIHQKIISHNLMPVSYDPATRTLSRLDGYNKNGDNTLYVRDFEKIQSFCRAAPARIIHTADHVQV